MKGEEEMQKKDVLSSKQAKNGDKKLDRGRKKPPRAVVPKRNMVTRAETDGGKDRLSV